MDKKPMVPPRQRHYDWTDQVTTLFEDLDSAIDDAEDDYFLGMVVVAEKPKSRPEVVDGQQRLATCTMLIAAIRDYLREETTERELADAYERDFLLHYDTKLREWVPHLRLNVDDADFFRDYVLRPPGDPNRVALEKSKKKLGISTQKIKDAAHIARARVQTIVAGAPDSAKADRLVKWVDYLKDNARIIWFSVPNREQAYRVFETMNDRGLDLSKSDLLKNYLFEEIGEDDEPAGIQLWSSMTGILEAVARSEPPATFIRHMWISQNGPTREHELYKSVKKSIRGHAKSMTFTKDLAERATDYAAILNSDHDRWRGLGAVARRDVATLVMLKSERIRPVMLAVMQCFEGDELKKALRLFVAWWVRYIIAGGVAGTVERKLGEMARDVSEEKIRSSKELAKALSEIVASDQEFENSFSIAKVSKTPLARYYLRVLESVRRGEEDDSALAVDESEEKANLEHILPANPSADWGLDSPEGQETVRENLTRLGNLCLMRKRLNGAAANGTIDQKAPLYAQEQGLYLTSELGGLTKWGPHEIELRQKKLAKLAVKAWSLKV